MDRRRVEQRQRTGRPSACRRLAAVTPVLLAWPIAGCVERTMRITTQPPGAVVVVNDEEVGLSPVKFSFLWYGDYDIIIRKEGYRTVKSHHRVNAPWYQFPVIDLVAEHLVPGTLRDAHDLPTFVLEPATQPAVSDVVQRAAELRERTLYQGQ